MGFDKILNPSSLGRTPLAVLVNKSIVLTKKNKENKMKKKDGIGTITERADRNDMVSARADTASGLSFGHTLQGDVMRARKELRKLFGKSTVCRIDNFAKAVKHGSQSILKVCLLKLYGCDAHSLLETGAVPNLTSTRLARKLDLAITST